MRLVTTLMLLQSIFHTSAAFSHTPRVLRAAHGVLTHGVAHGMGDVARLRPCLRMMAAAAKPKGGPAPEAELSEEQIVQRPLEKAQMIRDAGELPFAYSFDATHTAVQVALSLVPTEAPPACCQPEPFCRPPAPIQLVLTRSICSRCAARGGVQCAPGRRDRR